MAYPRAQASGPYEAMTGLGRIENNACLAFVVFCTTTNTGYIYGSMKAVELAD